MASSAERFWTFPAVAEWRPGDADRSLLNDVIVRLIQIGLLIADCEPGPGTEAASRLRALSAALDSCIQDLQPIALGDAVSSEVRDLGPAVPATTLEVAVRSAWEDVHRSSEALASSLHELVASSTQLRRRYASGRPMLDLVADPGYVESRDATAEAASVWHSAVHRSRVAVVRMLVDGYAQPMSQIATALGVSRQVVSRLYHAGREPH